MQPDDQKQNPEPINPNQDWQNSDFNFNNDWKPTTSNSTEGLENLNSNQQFSNAELNNTFGGDSLNDFSQSSTNQNNFNNPNSFNQPNQNSNSNSNPESLNFEPKKYSKITNTTSSIRRMARTVAFILVLGLILSSIAVVLVVVNPKDERSKWVIKNSFLNNLVESSSGSSVSTTVTQGETSSSSSQNSSTAVSNNPNLAFKDPTDSKEVTQIVEDVFPTVLSISLKSKSNGVDLGQDLSAGSGYIVSEDGLVVTNKHVVATVCKNDISRIQITGVSSDQKIYNLTLKSIDPVDDLAVLKIEGSTEKFKTVSFFDSEKLKLGQEVVAIGNVLGELQNTVTRGIVSGLDRSFETEIKDQCTDTTFQADNLIQTDAAINRGNSGGPLFNASGQLIGMNTLGTVDAQNIGLAIPSRTIKTVLEGYLTKGQIVRPRIGLASLQITPLRKSQNSWIPVDYGEIIFSEQGSPIAKDSAAAQAGLKEGDIILEVDGEKIVSSRNNPSPLRRAILGKQAESKVKLAVLKSNGKSEAGYAYEKNPVTVDLTLGSVSFDLVKKQAVIG